MAKSVPTESLSTLLPKALSAVLHKTSAPGLNSDPPQPSRGPVKHSPPNLEQLQTELRDLRDQFDQMKSQHKYGSVNVVPIPGNHWRCYGFNQGSFVYRSDSIFVSCCSKEIKLLMNELDEEKRIRLTLQVCCEKQRNPCGAPARMLIIYKTILNIWQNYFKETVHPKTKTLIILVWVAEFEISVIKMDEHFPLCSDTVHVCSPVRKKIVPTWNGSHHGLWISLSKRSWLQEKRRRVLRMYVFWHDKPSAI